MGRGSQWASVSLPPAPIHKATPEQSAETAAMVADMLARHDRNAAAYAERTARPTDAQRERRAARDYARKLRALLRETAEANRWARIETALDGFTAFECRAKADALRDKVKQRTRRLYERAAQGCEVSAAFLADENLDPLYAEALRSNDDVI